jgi:hypothetical protein
MNTIGYADIIFRDGNTVRIDIWDNGLSDMHPYKFDPNDIRSIRSTFYPENPNSRVESMSEHFRGERRGPERVRLNDGFD